MGSALLAAPARVPGNSQLDVTLNQLDRAGASFRSMSGDIHRVHHMAVINDDDVDSGTILLKRVKAHEMRMLVDLKQPDSKVVTVAGRKADMYLPKANTVQEYDLGKHSSLLDQLFLVGFGTTRQDLEEAYQIRLVGPETVNGQNTTRLELTPKSKDVSQHLQKFELWVSNATGYPVQQKFYMPGGEYMLVTYSNVKINPDLPDSALKLHLPKNVKWEYPQR